ncbi:MAG TPA: hypothetical protein VM031_05270 [Phycisphaerae bacterium]|nr:hypothetical protein [Phycisphaerae bacterium]
MMQCEQCECYHRSERGEVSFSCDPFRNVKEPECLAKWQLIKINQMVAAYQATLDYYRKLAPMQEKMFKVMEREIDDLNEGEKWRIADDEEEDEGDEGDEETPGWEPQGPL